MATRSKLTVGLPRALLYHRYAVLWRTYFDALGIDTVVSGETNRAVAERGLAAASDEMCLSLKVYLGHVEALIGRCDRIFIPRIVDFGIRRVMCTTFEGLPDIAANIFRDRHIDILSCNISVQGGIDEKDGMIQMGTDLGYSKKEAKRAYKRALAAQRAADEAAVAAADQLYKSDGLKIAVGAHPYVMDDDYYGRPVLDYLSEMGVTAIPAYAVDRREARKVTKRLSPTMKWEVSREIAGSLAMHLDDVDGIILMSVYPCALDSMVNDMLVRKFRDSGVPMMNLTMDAQSGTAGLETRLESFIDILSMRRTGKAAKG